MKEYPPWTTACGEVLRAKSIRWEVVITGSDAVKGTDVVADALNKHPDIRIVLCTGQADTEAAGRALEKTQRGKDYWTAGFDLSPKILQLIRDGKIYCTIDQQPYIQGFYPVVQLTHYLRYGIRPSDVDAGATIVDQTNADAVTRLTEQGYR